jgi:hypothetical protein
VPSCLSRYDLYELCVQAPDRTAPFLYAVHGGDPRTLREDFCGSGGVCRAWAAMTPRPPRRAPFRAIGVDLDPEPLQRLRGHRTVKPVRSDVLSCDLKADIISATNFPIGYWHTRKDLLRYLRHTRKCLNHRGVFVCDTYGGATAFTPGSTVRDFFLPDGARIRYTWQQASADPTTGMVTDIIHFRGFRDREVVLDVPDAFTYRWRLWSIPELRDAMLEAGFASIDIYTELADAADSDGRIYVRPIADHSELGDDWIVCLAARTAAP